MFVLKMFPVAVAALLLYAALHEGSHAVVAAGFAAVMAILRRGADVPSHRFSFIRRFARFFAEA